VSLILRGSFVAMLAALVAVAFAATALGSSAGQSATSIKVTAGKPSELAFTLTKKSAPKGVVVFHFVNRGAISHDFQIGGKRTAHVLFGKTATLRVTFTKAGKYKFLCTVPGHAAAGMRGILTIK
jgi:uncharacterized cupredoxin-like copper-binding protein